MISQLGNGSLLNAAWFEEVNATLVPSVGVIIQLMLRAAWVPHWKGAGALLHLAFKSFAFFFFPLWVPEKSALFYFHLNKCHYVQNKQKFSAKLFIDKVVQFFMYHKPF